MKLSIQRRQVKQDEYLYHIDYTVVAVTLYAVGDRMPAMPPLQTIVLIFSQDIPRNWSSNMLCTKSAPDDF